MTQIWVNIGSVVWQHQAITCTNVDLSSKWFCGIIMKAILILSIHIEPLSFHVKTTLRKGYSRKFMNVTNPERMAKATLTTTFVWNLKVLALKIAPIMQKRSKLLIRSLCTYFTRYETHPPPRGYSHNKLEALRERKPTPRLVWGAWNSLFWCETV